MLQDNQFQPSASLAAALQAPGINRYPPWLFEELTLKTYNGLSGDNSCTPLSS